MAEVALQGGRERFAKPLFLATVVFGSFLLFLTQPMIARMALPRIGGAPAVWNSAMLVYQALLLAGYAYAHALSGMRPRQQAVVHITLFAISALWLPIGLMPVQMPTNIEPTLWVPFFLVASIGPLFFIVSTQAPLMQRWYALETRRGDPYPLYAASNLGSFAGLISYPLLVEPFMPLDQQSIYWTIGYGLLVLMVAGCALTIPGAAVEQQQQSAAGERPSLKQIAHWIILAAVPSGLMLSTTTHLTTDIVAMPLLWVLPLGLYLLSFVVAFSTRRRPTTIITFVTPLIMLLTGAVVFSRSSQNPVYSASFELLLLFAVAVALHGEMYRLRPEPARLTHFYLAMAVGGMLGGLFCAIIAPIIFDWTWEHPLLLLAAAVLIPQRPLLKRIERLWNGRLGRILFLVVPLLALGASLLVGSYVGWLSGYYGIAGGIFIVWLALFSLGRNWVFAFCLATLMLCYGGWNMVRDSLIEHKRLRSYFGVYTIETYNFEAPFRDLQHGTTLHGIQSMVPELQRMPTTYYAPRSGVGLAMANADRLYGRYARVGVVGLGTGTLSCYAQPGQDWTFFEIDPVIVDIAGKSGNFIFLGLCAPGAHIVIGDARVSLVRQQPATLDMLALDAFSSDAVPIHLLTQEAFGVYGRALQPKGMLLVHISNRYMDLVPVVMGAARQGNWQAAMLDYFPNDREIGLHASRSTWIALSRDPDRIRALMAVSKRGGTWVPMRQRPSAVVWTDDYASILPLLRIGNFNPFNQ